MRRSILVRATLILFFLGCARVSVQAPDKPIKVDVTMRLDIYQHIERDIDSVEKIISGKEDKQSFLDRFIDQAYAEDREDQLPPEVEKAALRRRQRKEELMKWQAKGVIGENRLGFVVIRNQKEASPPIEDLIESENKDRLIIFEAIAKKNGTSLQQVQTIYVNRHLHPDAPKGTPLEIFNEKTGTYEWKIK